jgi:transglutaminase/protease-like cytokinesis protein 3
VTWVAIWVAETKLKYDRFFFLLANPVRFPQNIIVADDKSNWEAVWNEPKDNPIVSSQDDKNIFDRIVEINAKERGN